MIATGSEDGAANTINGMWDVFAARTVEQAQQALRRYTLSANWLRLRRLIQDRRHGLEVVVGPEWVPPGRELVEHDAQREQIRGWLSGKALQLLRRHVGDRPHDRAVRRQVPDAGRLGGRVAVRAPLEASDRHAPRLGETEIEHFHAAVLRQHDVRRL